MMKNKNKEDLSTKKINNTFVLQHGQSDCGVACLLSVIKYYGGNGSLEKLRELSGTTKQGTSLLGLYQSANQLGFEAYGCEADIKILAAFNEPVILHVLMNKKLQHYVVCYGYIDEYFIIGDPAKGIVYYNQEELMTIWESKTCLTLHPNDQFVTSKIEKHSKKKWFFNLVKEDFQLLLFSVVLGVITSFLGMAMAIFSQKLIDDILPSKDFNRLIVGIVLVVFMLIFKTLFTVLRSYFLIRQAKDFNNRIVDHFYSSLLDLPRTFFDTRKIGELVSRLNDTQRIQQVIRQVTNNFVVNLLVSLVSLVFLFYYSWQTGLIASCTLPFYFLLVYSFNKIIIKTQKEVMQSRAHSQSNYITTMNGIVSIKNNNKQSVFQKINKLIYGNYQNKAFSLGVINLKLSLFSGVFSVLFLVSILTYNSLNVYYDTLQLGELMAILGIAGSLLPSVASLALIAIPINEAKVAFNRMYEFAAIEKEKDGTHVLSSLNSLSINSVSFRFAGRSQLLKNISLKVKKGECIAIVGESGSGKSTLGKIIQKFYTPENGNILINDTLDLNEITNESWRNHIAVIEQDIHVFSGTVMDNIAMGVEVSYDSIVAFCEEFGFDKFIETFPQGYMTNLGEEGVNISGGQKQILALARALYKKPQFLILDEYTSAMDRISEQFSLQLLHNIKDKIAIIFISHRLHSLPKIADRIYVIEEGQTITSGSHSQLMLNSNFYSDFWTQMSNEFTGCY